MENNFKDLLNRRLSINRLLTQVFYRKTIFVYLFIKNNFKSLFIDWRTFKFFNSEKDFQMTVYEKNLSQFYSGTNIDDQIYFYHFLSYLYRVYH